MAKKSEKSENKRESLRRVKECPKKKAKEAPKRKAMESKMAPIIPRAGMTYDEMVQKVAIDDELNRRAFEDYNKMKRAQNERIMNEFLSIGYVFNPAEEQLLDYYLKNKIMDKPMNFCPIKEANVYGKHPQTLIGESGVWYFFTRSRPNEIQPDTDTQGHWIFGEKNDVFNQDGKVGVKQVVEYCEAGHKSKYKIIEYQLDPAPDDMKAGLWFVCKLYNDGSCVDVHSGP